MPSAKKVIQAQPSLSFATKKSSAPSGGAKKNLLTAPQPVKSPKKAVVEPHSEYYTSLRKKNGFSQVKLIHSLGDKSDYCLKMFDLNPLYGPCTGMTRLERWDRAYELDLAPPPEIREILADQSKLDNIFHGRI